MAHQFIEEIQTLDRLSAGLSHALNCENPETMREMVRVLGEEISAVLGGINYAVEQAQSAETNG